MDKSIETLSPTEKVSMCLELMKTRKIEKDLWGPELLQLTTVEYADFDEQVPTVVFKLRTKQNMANLMGFMHGGCVTTFVDNTTTYATFGDPRYWKNASDMGQAARKVISEFGVSRTLNTTFVRPVPLDSEVILTCRVQSNSARYVYISFELKDAFTGKQLAVGYHDKAKPAAGSKL